MKRTKKFTIPKNALKGKKGILLDMDNTLYDYAACNDAGLIGSYEYLRKKKELTFKDFKKKYLTAREKTKKQLNGLASSHSRLLNFQKLLEKIYGRTQAGMALGAEKAYWDNFFKKMRI